MTISRVGTDVVNGAASGSPTAAYVAGILAGDVIVVTLGCRGSSGVPTFTTPPGFTQSGTDSNSNTRAAWYWKIAAGNESGTSLVVTVAGGAGWGICVGVRRSTNGFVATPVGRFALATQVFLAEDEGDPRAGTSITTPQLNLITPNNWSQSGAVYGSAGGLATISGTGWSNDGTIATSGAGVSSASNSTGVGSLPQCTHTLAASANIMGCSYTLTENTAAAIVPGGPLMVCEA